MPRPHDPDRPAPARRRGRLLAAGIALAALALPAPRVATAAERPPPVLELREAERIASDGTVRAVRLPDRLRAAGTPPSPDGMLHARYRFRADLGAAPQGLSLWWSGVYGHPRVRVNGAAVLDELPPAAAPAPRGTARLRLVPLADALLRPGVNEIEIELAAPALVDLSPLHIGPQAALRAAHQAKAFAIADGPALAAAVVGSLGLGVLLLFARRPGEAVYGFFGAAATAWGLHTLWTLLPVQPLPSPHNYIGWTWLYSCVVTMLAVFALRFAGYRAPRVERALHGYTLAAPLALYAAASFDVLEAAAEAWRLGMVTITVAAFVAVAVHAWRRRSADSTLLLVAGLSATALGARDWWVAHRDDDHLPVMLAPYAALPFVALVTWYLVDRLARTTEQLEGVNRDLERRVALKSAELTAALAHTRAARDEAEAASRAKTRFLASASHDLRQPVHALGLYVTALQQHTLSPLQRGLTERIQGSVAALQSMFDALLDISRIDARSIEPARRAFELGPLLRRLADDFAAQATPRGLRLALHLDPALDTARADTDPLLLERVLRNLLGNAVKYTGQGGVLLSCRRRRGPPAVWRIEVWDTGPGIAAAEQDRVFDEFYQLANPQRDRRGGLGLGLSIVRRLTQLLGLPLQLSSRPGHGTRVRLDLPWTDAPAAADPAPAAGGSLAGLGVAVIEDDEEVRDAMHTLLGTWGCRVAAGSDAAETMARARQDEIRLHAVVADLRLRDGRDGVGEIDALNRACGRMLPALVVSGDSAPDRLALIHAHGLPWLPKPVAAPRLRSWLAEVRRGAAPPGEVRRDTATPGEAPR